jgi:hypothetical protein
MTETVTVPVLWTEKRTEVVMELPPGSLKRDRHRGIGMSYVVLTKRRISYRADDVAGFHRSAHRHAGGIGRGTHRPAA